MKKRIMLIGLLFLLCITCLMSCSRVEQNAILYDNAGKWMSPEFLDDNLTQGAQSADGTWAEDVNLRPPYFTHIVTNSNRFNEIFLEFPDEINFETQMVIIYITTNIYMGNSYKLTRLILNYEVLNVEIKRQVKLLSPRYASAPMQRCFVIVMNKNNIIDTNITIVR